MTAGLALDQADGAQACACGSGLRADRCCAFDWSAQPNPPRPTPEVDEARRALAGRRPGARRTDACPPAQPESRATSSRSACCTTSAAPRAIALPPRRCWRGSCGWIRTTWRRRKAGAGAVQPRRAGRGRAACAQRRAPGPDRRAVAQSDGHDPDRGAAAAGRRAPLSPRAGAARPAASRSCSPTSPGT